MKKAVIIVAHQLPEQLNMFIAQLLHDSEIDVFLHINKRYEKMKKDIIKFNNRLFILEDSIYVDWGSDSILKAILMSLRYTVTIKKYDYYIIASGQDFLVNNGLDEFLSKNKGTMYVDTSNINLNYAERVAKSRLMYRWPKIFLHRYDFKFNPIKIMRKLFSDATRRGMPFFKKKVSHDISGTVFYLDYFWVTIPYDIFTFIMEKSEDKDLMSLYFNSHIPEEEFFTTLVMNSEFKDRIRFVNGKSNSLCYIKEFHNNHPEIIRIDDIDDIEKSNYFFARKFDIRVDKKVIDYFYNKIMEDNK